MSTSLVLLIWVVFTAYQSKCFALMLLLSFFGGGFFFFLMMDGTYLNAVHSEEACHRP